MTVEIPTWLLSTIVAAVAAVLLFVLRSFFLQGEQAKWQSGVNANLLAINNSIAEMKTQMALMHERFGTVKAQVDAVEKRSDSQAQAHNNAMTGLRSEFLGRK